MGVITNGSGGGAGGGIRYNAQTDMIQVKVNGQWVDTPYKAYGTFNGMLYDGGVQAVPWDNTGYKADTSDTIGGYAILSADSFTFNAPGIAGGSKVIITDNKINLNGFTTLKVIMDGVTYTQNISAYSSEQEYVAIRCYRDNSNRWYLYTLITSTKENYATNQLAYETQTYGNIGATIPSITKVWLE